MKLFVKMYLNHEVNISICQHVVHEIIILLTTQNVNMLCKYFRRILMSVRCKLGDIMKQRRLSNKDVVALTGVSRNTITSLAANATKRIDYDTLEGLCRGLGVTPGDLIEYVPDDNTKTP
ncbi:helix-turn-helix domain-containing protein [Paenibacillus tyrfis]